MALVIPDGKIEVFAGKIQGNLVFPPRGCNGFGYDSIFYVPSHNKTFAEMDINEKQTCSHRSVAISNLQTLFEEHKLLSNQ